MQETVTDVSINNEETQAENINEERFNIKRIMDEKKIDFALASEMIREVIPDYKVKGGIYSKFTKEEFDKINKFIGESSKGVAPINNKNQRILDMVNSIQGELVDILYYRAEANQTNVTYTELKKKIADISKIPSKVKKTIITNETWLKDPKFLSVLFGGYKYAIIPKSMTRRSRIVENIRGMFCELYNSDETNDYFILANETEVIYIFLII